MIVNSDPNNVTGSVVKPDIFSCIELTMAIVFASVAGIAGREAISNFVHHFIVPRPTKSYGDRYRPAMMRQGSSGADLEDTVRMVDKKNWVRIGGKGRGGLVRTNVEEVPEEV